jgi:hypothetical protein
MKKIVAIAFIALLGISLLSACGSRRGDKCPGVGQVEQTNPSV